MVAPKIGEQEFIRLIEERGIAGTARTIGVNFRNVYKRRENLEKKLRRQIRLPEGTRQWSTRHASPHPHRLCFDVENGCVLVGSDGHYWPGAASTAHKAFVKFCKELKPKAIVKNGDAFDGAKVSRFSPDWEHRPEVIDELEAAQERLSEIEEAAPHNVPLYWPLGNHDGRWETKLATVAPEYARVHGFHLKDHFSKRWRPCWTVFVNNDLVIRHRPAAGGINATRNSVIKARKSMCFGHLHSLKVTPVSAYDDRPLFGIDCGMLAEPYGPQFLYNEDGPVDWRSGFAVLTWKNGMLLWPEVVHVVRQNVVEFRGELITV